MVPTLYLADCGYCLMCPGRIHLVLEYCRGGDLSAYIQRHGKVPEATAKHFMLQLGTSSIAKSDNLCHVDMEADDKEIRRGSDLRGSASFYCVKEEIHLRWSAVARVVQRFQELFSQTKYKEAAELAMTL
ncbi:hypothetical protein IFM89_019952 [Coptis chinensis]|uniref:Protein kinase domain-containing protein n=1 Tax=Coptis chinensis TaxID=261450 RepID=A0A835HE04_9MAGN|nr:hypothetical protein IFM89_019952 [Coptis chinensis]